METQPSLSALEQAELLIAEYNIKNANLFDHTPVLRIQVPDSEFQRVLDMRTKLAEELKSTGFRFIAVDLESETEL